MARHCLSLLAVSTVCFAAAPSPGPNRSDDPAPVRPALAAPLPPSERRSDDELAELAKTDAVALLDACRRRAAALHGYKATLVKRERINGKLHDEEVIRTWVRAEPYSVLMLWDKGAREVLGTATEGTLYVSGENNGKIKVWRPSARLLPKFLDIHPTDAHSPARSASRYAITEGGLLHAPERTYRAWSDVKSRGRLHVKYEGKRKVDEVGGRVCHVITRTADPATIDPFLMAEEPPDPARRAVDTSKSVTLMIDAETWLQVGSRITNPDGQLVGEYYFRDVELNPKFAPDQFKPSAFRK
ncbi:MAG TPA: DUF1571 domain-containing protein [Fimbriiglobus sp.]|jgi:hypothetical protein|nr:DUF1571 domain-containing protein [Fimbriiglobus sp.]